MWQLLTSLTGTSIMQGHAPYTSYQEWLLITSSVGDQGMSFPKEAVWRLFLHLLSHVWKFLEKWMIVNRLQNFFDLSKLQRHGEVSSAMQVPRSESLASSSSRFQALLYARCCMPGSDSQKWYELELCPQVIYIPGSMTSHCLQANAETLSTPQEALGRLPLLHLHTSSGQIKEFSFPGHFWYFTVTAIMPLFKFLPDDFPGTIWCGEKDTNIKARFSHSTCCVFFCRSVSLSEPQFP